MEIEAKTWGKFTAFCRDNNHVLALSDDPEFLKAAKQIQSGENPEAVAAWVASILYVKQFGARHGLYMVYKMQRILLATTKSGDEVRERVHNLHSELAWCWSPTHHASDKFTVALPRARRKIDGLANVLLWYCATKLDGTLNTERLALHGIKGYLEFLKSRG